MPSRRDFLLSSLAIPALSKLTLAGQSRVAPGGQAFTVRSQGVATINFDGMIALAMGNPSRVSAGILDAHHHTPKMVVTKVGGNSNGRETDSEVIATLDAKQLRGGLFIDLQAATRAAEKCQVSKYYCTEGVRGDKNDLRWCLSMDELYPNAGPLTIKENLLWGKIHINGGEWYTSELSDMKWRFFSNDGMGKALDFNRQIGSTSAQIPMDRGDVLVVRGNGVDLTLTSENDEKYELRITNLPPAEMSDISHFLHYFDVIEQDLPRYVPVATSRAALPNPFLCATIALNQTVLSTP